MESLGLALAVLPAFSVCLEYFQLYKTAKATSFDSQVLLFKFDCEHENFIIWGEKHGVLKPSGDQDRNPELDSPDKAEKISKALELIRTLLSDAKALRDTYGVTTTTNSSDAPPQDRQDESYPSNSGLKRLKWLSKRLGPGKQGPSLIEKTRWAINDKNKFGQLIDHIRDLVERLYKILPVAEEERNHMAIKDIRSLAGNLERLKFFEEASLGAYPVWSGAASVMLEAGSTRIGPDNISQWMEKVEEDSDSADKVRYSKPAEGEDDTLGLDIETWYNYKCYFVFTSTCLTSALGLSCDMDRLEVRSDGPSHVFDNDNRRIWGLGSRFNKLIVPKMPLIDFERISDAPYEVQGHLDTFLESHYPLAKVKILCPPCRCAVRTALLVCSQQSSKKVEYKVGIDDRMPVSCCPEAEKLQRLRSLFKTLRELDEGSIGDEAVGIRKDLLKHLDRPSLEHRIYRLETELYDNEHYKRPSQQVAELLSETRDADGIPIYLGEASRCAWIVQKAPFPWSPRVPKESEIFKFERDYVKVNFTSTYLGTFTSSSQLTHAVVPTPRSHSRRKGPKSLVSSNGAITPQPAQQGHQFGSSPDADNLDHLDLTKGEQELDESSESAGSGHMDHLDEPNRVRNESERATKRFRLS
ncbi:prion-inhibition and propagation-domain-containing protein [Thelonectria olida]|uniref:Prion-inhibition and propagation-domain-containing protein n=1 Tax=Thelonectria olida TaxID=1576542 RepID=A0A9P9AI51_9HYPO|nr:prion-inhibition and propagation-domain-containing protein [Thelonectria olida]